MKLDEIYSLRSNFIVIGLTGRIGSGCSEIAELLSGTYEEIKEKGLRDFQTKETQDSTFIRKYNIVNNFIKNEGNWTPFELIKYRNVLFLYIVKNYGNDIDKYQVLFEKYLNDVNPKSDYKTSLSVLFQNHKNTIEEIKSLERFENIKKDADLEKLDTIFFGELFNKFCLDFSDILKKHDYYLRLKLLHNISKNIRQSGDIIGDSEKDISKLYEIAGVINKVIKAKKHANKNNPTRIVIDSLRNSLEIMFFKERYSGFYMLAAKDVLDNSKDRIFDKIPKSINETERHKITDKILKLDNQEYGTKDFSKGIFSSPDVENCIQKSDYHILNLKKNEITKYLNKYTPPYDKFNFLSREEQLIKLISLIIQPGLITPSSVERSMQVANSAKLNSGCISRNVGAAITDSHFHVKSIGWNDVAKGHTPCNLREAEDIIYVTEQKKTEINIHYSPFEMGNASDNSSFKYKNEKPGDFKEALSDYFKLSLESHKEDLKGKNCAFCFKTVHNHYEGEANQVHTRSLHAEENAMLQITKLGGQGVENGILFTTASPCELCSKKAYQLGIKTIYFIDPYPGISNDQILRGGRENTQPKMIPFSGAIGLAYHKCYDSFMSYKDEVTMTLEMEVENKIGIQFKELLKSIKKKDRHISALLDSSKTYNDNDVIAMISKMLKKEDEKRNNQDISSEDIF